MIQETTDVNEILKIGAFSIESVFNEYYDRLVYFSFKIVKDKLDAEDIVQESFVRYWKRRNNIAHDKALIKSYLYSTVKNISLNLIRHQQVVKGFETQFFIRTTDEKNVIHKIIQAEVFSKIHNAIELLPAACQKISRMGYIDGMKNHEIASELGISVNTVKTQKQRGAKILRVKLIPELIACIIWILSYR